MRRILTLVTLFALCSSSAWADYKTPTTPGTAGTVSSMFNALQGVIAKKTTLTQDKRLKNLLKSFKAIEDKGVWMRGKKRIRIIKAALAAEKATGVDATLMLAVGRMESDFRPLILVDKHCNKRVPVGASERRCYADCGITQVHVRGSRSFVLRRCKKLAKYPKLAFLASAKEIARHITWCKNNIKKKVNTPLRRCVLNRYNQGPAFKTRARCSRSNRCWQFKRKEFPTLDLYKNYLKSCFRARGKCRNRAAYWTKTTCFEYGARKQMRSTRSCRRCHYVKDIPKFYLPKKKRKKRKKRSRRRTKRIASVTR